MKKTLLTLGLLLAGAVAANAQTDVNPTSNITLTGTVSKSVDMRIIGVSGNNTGVTASGVSATAATIDLGEMSPNRASSSLNNGYAAFTVNIAIRSNTPYRVQANSNVSQPPDTVGGSEFSLDDIGFAVLNPAASGDGARVLDASITRGTSNADSPGGNSGAAIPAVDPSLSAYSNGVPSYALTLNDITANSNIFTGNRVSNQGNVDTANNAVIVPLRFAAAPQFYSVGSFNGQVRLDIFPNP